MKLNGKRQRNLLLTFILAVSVLAVTVLIADVSVIKNRISGFFEGRGSSEGVTGQTLTPTFGPVSPAEPSAAFSESTSPDPAGATNPVTSILPAASNEPAKPTDPSPSPKPGTSTTPTASAKPPESVKPIEPTPRIQGPTPAVSKRPPAPSPAPLAKWPSEGTVPILYHPVSIDSADPSVQIHPLAGLTVILDPGHGGSDVGAEWTKASPTIYEAPINLAVSILLRDRLESLGARVEMTRTSDSFQSLHYRAAKVAKRVLSHHRTLAGADISALDHLVELIQPSLDLNTDLYAGNGRSIFKGLGANADLRAILDIEKQYEDIVLISIHCNSLPASPSVNGLQILWSSGASIYSDENKSAKNPRGTTEALVNPSYQFYNDAGRKQFADTLWTAMTDAFPGLHTTGGVPDIVTGNFAVLRETNFVSAVVEMGFLSNTDDRTDLLSNSGQDGIATGIAEGIRRWYLR